MNLISRLKTSKLWRDFEEFWKLRMQVEVSPNVSAVKMELRYAVESERPLSQNEVLLLEKILRESYEQQNLRSDTVLTGRVFEVGPRRERITPLSSNIVDICQSCGLTSVTRVEQFRRFRVKLRKGSRLSAEQQATIYNMLHDRMTEQPYPEPLVSFETNVVPEPVRTYPVMEEGIEAIRRANKELDLSYSEERLRFVFRYFRYTLKRNPTDVELFIYSQRTSDHCNHDTFKALFVIDGVVMRKSPMQWVRSTFENNRGNAAVALSDNAAALDPEDVVAFVTTNPLRPSAYSRVRVQYCFLFKVETHNHPTTISPYEGAATGVAVRRDIFCFGRGGIPVAHIAGHYTNNLLIPGFIMPWEKVLSVHPKRLATPLQIAIEASNGASDNANCFGNPVIAGVFRTFGQMVGGTEYGYTKTVMAAGSCGFADSRHIKKNKPRKGWFIVQIGGSAYTVGVRGGSGSSGDAGVSAESNDFQSVQRANPVNEQINMKVFRAFVDMGDENPLETANDLGAGGDSVAPPELAGSAGGKIEVRKIPVGERGMSVMVITGNESQERNLFLVKPKKLALVLEICKRFDCQAAVIGRITGNGKFIMTDSQAKKSAPRHIRVPVSVHTRFFLEDAFRKRIVCERVPMDLSRLRLPRVGIMPMFGRVLRLPSVASKDWLMKGDRSVTGLIAQQQTVGRLQLPLADCAVVANSFNGFGGNAIAIGEQPIVGLIDPARGVEMSIGEALTNLVWASVSGFNDINFSATWQWPCKQKGWDARLYDAVEAAAKLLISIGLRIIVGKDSVSMVAWTMKNGKPHPIVAPGTVQMIAFAPCVDIRRTVTPDIKAPGYSKLMFIDLAAGFQRLGGSALAQVYNQIGNDAPGIVSRRLLRCGFEAVQTLIREKLVLSGHDRSGGGLIACLSEMAFGGNCGIDVSMNAPGRPIPFLFNEELGLVIEYEPGRFGEIREILRSHGVFRFCHNIGSTTVKRVITFRRGSSVLVRGSTDSLRSIWEEPAYQIERLQSNPKCAEEKRRNTRSRSGLKFKLSFTPGPMVFARRTQPKVAILNAVGTNGQVEMARAFDEACFSSHDVLISDLRKSSVGLREFRGAVWPGGFANMDAIASGRGVSAEFTFNPILRDLLRGFRSRKDTFMLGVCNGDQAVSQMDLVPWSSVPPSKQPRFVRNESRRFEPKFLAVKVLRSPSIFFNGMENSVLGIWVAHGEGLCYWPDKSLMRIAMRSNLVPLVYVDDDGNPTEKYPFNPNGSPCGITSLCSEDGRITIMMPHPERGFLSWQWAYWPREWPDVQTSPWLRMFQNARKWCDETH